MGAERRRLGDHENPPYLNDTNGENEDSGLNASWGGSLTSEKLPALGMRYPPASARVNPDREHRQNPPTSTMLTEVTVGADTKEDASCSRGVEFEEEAEVDARVRRSHWGA